MIAPVCAQPDGIVLSPAGLLCRSRVPGSAQTTAGTLRQVALSICLVRVSTGWTGQIEKNKRCKLLLCKVDKNSPGNPSNYDSSHRRSQERTSFFIGRRCGCVSLQQFLVSSQLQRYKERSLHGADDSSLLQRKHHAVSGHAFLQIDLDLVKILTCLRSKVFRSARPFQPTTMQRRKLSSMAEHGRCVNGALHACSLRDRASHNHQAGQCCSSLEHLSVTHLVFMPCNHKVVFHVSTVTS